MAKYVVLLHNTSDAETASLNAAMKTADAGWWHWIPNVWIISDSQSRGIGHWNSIVRKAAPNTSILVVAADEAQGYTGFMPKPWHEWLTDHWKH